MRHAALLAPFLDRVGWFAGYDRSSWKRRAARGTAAFLRFGLHVARYLPKSGQFALFCQSRDGYRLGALIGGSSVLRRLYCHQTYDTTSPASRLVAVQFELRPSQSKLSANHGDWTGQALKAGAWMQAACSARLVLLFENSTMAADGTHPTLRESFRRIPLRYQLGAVPAC